MAERLEIPKDISPKDFFERFIPEQFEKAKALLPDPVKALSASMVFSLTGDQGGAWTIKFNKGDLKIAQGDDPDRVVKIVQSVSDWRGAISGERGFRFELPGAGGGGKGGLPQGSPMTQEKIERLKSIDGAIMFRLTDKEKGDWTVTVQFGKSSKDTPDCTISVASEDAKAMRKGELNPQMAFMSGKIDIKGDLGFAMQVGTTFMM